MATRYIKGDLNVHGKIKRYGVELPADGDIAKVYDMSDIEAMTVEDYDAIIDGGYNVIRDGNNVGYFYINSIDGEIDAIYMYGSQIVTYVFYVLDNAIEMSKTTIDTKSAVYNIQDSFVDMTVAQYNEFISGGYNVLTVDNRLSAYLCLNDNGDLYFLCCDDADCYRLKIYIDNNAVEVKFTYLVYIGDVEEMSTKLYRHEVSFNGYGSQSQQVYEFTYISYSSRPLKPGDTLIVGYNVLSISVERQANSWSRLPYKLERTAGTSIKAYIDENTVVTIVMTSSSFLDDATPLPN